MSSWPLGMPLDLRHPSETSPRQWLIRKPESMAWFASVSLIPMAMFISVAYKTLYHLCSTKDPIPSQEKKDYWGPGLGTRLSNIFLKIQYNCPGWLVQLVRASSQYVKSVASMPGQATYKNQSVNHKLNNKSIFSLSNQSINFKNTYITLDKYKRQQKWSVF